VQDLKPAEVVSRYKALADIERGFRVLKSEIEIAPVHHRLPQRIRARWCPHRLDLNHQRPAVQSVRPLMASGVCTSSSDKALAVKRDK
jgi:hypothetical protein